MRERGNGQETVQGSSDVGEIVSAGDSALLLRFGTEVSPTVHARVMALLRTLDRDALAGVRDVVPAYASALVLFDPLMTSRTALEPRIRSALTRMRLRAPVGAGRLIHLPVEYGGAAGPDLQDVARLVGLSPEEVVRRHAEVEYRVYFLGFLAGFPYLGGLPAELIVPRLPSPRVHVPAGSVGLAGQQTGVYSSTTPGAWRIIGRTPTPLFDPLRQPPALLRPGDRVRFDPLPSGTGAAVAGSAVPSLDSGVKASRSMRAHERRDSAMVAAATPGDGIPWVTVRVPGPLSTVQDLGRPGFARYGVSTSGAADADALHLGNVLVGNAPGMPALEVTLGGAEFEILAPCVVAITGAACALYRNGRQVPADATLALAPSDTLRLGVAPHSARIYLCVAGGVRTARVMGSSSTDLRAALGGIAGRALRADDVLWRGEDRVGMNPLAGRRMPADDLRRSAARTPTIRIVAGQHADDASDDLEALVASDFVVDSRSDRVGVRLQPGGLRGARRPVGGETISEGVPRGAIQVPPNGEPIILLADHQTTGGYLMPAVVAAADLWRVAQLRPGDTLRFVLVTVEKALAALRARAAWLEWLAANGVVLPVNPRQGSAGPDVALLMAGFAEWSEEEIDED